MSRYTLNPSSDTLTTARNRLRLQRSATRLHRLDERALHEFLTELLANEAVAPIVKAQLEAWTAMEPTTVRAVLTHYCGGRSFPPALVEVTA